MQGLQWSVQELQGCADDCPQAAWLGELPRCGGCHWPQFIHQRWLGNQRATSRARSGDDPNLDDAQPVNEIFVVVTAPTGGSETSASGKGVVPTNGTPAVRGSQHAPGTTMSGACKTQAVRIFWPDFSGENFPFSATLSVANFVTLSHEKTGFFDW